MDLLVRAATEAETASGEAHAGSAGRPGRGRNGAKAAGAESVSGEPLDLPEFASASTGPVSVERISMLSDVTLNVKIELGRTRMLVEDVLRLDSGSVVELDKLAGDPVDVFANDRLIARGEVLVLNDSFCVRISEVFAGDPHRIV
jgi:flagellar motor switch protein FliN/FliY